MAAGECVAHSRTAPGLRSDARSRVLILMSGVAETLRQACVYPRKLLRTFPLRDTIAFVWAHFRRRPYVRLRVRSSQSQIWLRPRSTDIRVAYGIFGARELEMPWPVS